MHWRALVSLGVVVIIAGGALVYAWEAQYAPQGAPALPFFSQQNTPGGQTAQKQPTPPPFGVFSQTSSSVTVTDPDGVAHTFSLAKPPAVYSQVLAGQRGVTLAQIPADATVVVVSDQSGNATKLYLIPEMPLATEDAVPGPVSGKTSNSVTLLDPKGASRTFNVTADTRILSTVLAGQKGKTFADISSGAIIVVLPTAKGSSVAGTIIVQ